MTCHKCIPFLIFLSLWRVGGKRLWQKWSVILKRRMSTTFGTSDNLNTSSCYTSPVDLRIVHGMFQPKARHNFGTFTGFQAFLDSWSNDAQKRRIEAPWRLDAFATAGIPKGVRICWCLQGCQSGGLNKNSKKEHSNLSNLWARRY